MKKKMIRKKRNHFHKTSRQYHVRIGRWIPTLLVILFGVILVTLVDDIKVQDRIKNKIDLKTINYDKFRDIKISSQTIESLKNMENKYKIEYSKLITIYMLLQDYDLGTLKQEKINLNKDYIKRIIHSSAYLNLYKNYKAIFHDLKYFPIPIQVNGDTTVSFEDSWKSKRTYGGDRFHEGTDLMSSYNKRGYIPVLSITDGTVEKIGWLDQGGYRIGIRTKSGGYFYYAHLYSYAPEIKIGDKVIAGQMIGFMGDSGYGKEGTTGQFDVHLHLGIYINQDNKEISVNPYWILKYLEKYKLKCYY